MFKLFRKKLILFIELDKEKLKINPKGSCEIFSIFPNSMPTEDKEKAKQLINEYIDLVRKYF